MQSVSPFFHEGVSPPPPPSPNSPSSPPPLRCVRAGARNCGIFSVLVGVEQPSAAADVCIRSILDLPTAMPHLFVPRVGGSSRVHLTHE